MVEVATSLGIISFALFGLLGVLPVALDRYREAAAFTVSSDITRSISSDLDWAFSNDSVPDLSDRFYTSEGIEVDGESEGSFVAQMEDIAEVSGDLLGSSYPDLNRVTIRIYRLPLPNGATSDVEPVAIRTVFIQQSSSLNTPASF